MRPLSVSTISRLSGSGVRQSASVIGSGGRLGHGRQRDRAACIWMGSEGLAPRAGAFLALAAAPGRRGRDPVWACAPEAASIAAARMAPQRGGGLHAHRLELGILTLAPTPGVTKGATSPPSRAISLTRREATAWWMRVGHQEDGLDLAVELLVHGGHLELVLEVCHRRAGPRMIMSAPTASAKCINRVSNGRTSISQTAGGRANTRCSTIATRSVQREQRRPCRVLTATPMTSLSTSFTARPMMSRWPLVSGIEGPRIEAGAQTVRSCGCDPCALPPSLSRGLSTSRRPTSRPGERGLTTPRSSPPPGAPGDGGRGRGPPRPAGARLRKRGHAPHARRRHRLAVDVVGDVAGGVDAP